MDRISVAKKFTIFSTRKGVVTHEIMKLFDWHFA
jgi:hypothetical protein